MENKLKLLYPSIDVNVIVLVIEQAQSFVLDYCNLDEVPEALESVVLDMCKQDLNRLKGEGLSSEGAGGSSISYENDYSPQVYKRLKKHKRIVTI